MSDEMTAAEARQARREYHAKSPHKGGNLRFNDETALYEVDWDAFEERNRARRGLWGRFWDWVFGIKADDGLIAAFRLEQERDRQRELNRQ